MRPYIGARQCAFNIRQLTKGSTLMDSVPEKLQDAYSIRCTPQILGAVRDMLRFVEQQVSVEWNANTDNPLILWMSMTRLRTTRITKPFQPVCFMVNRSESQWIVSRFAISELATYLSGDNIASPQAICLNFYHLV